MPPPSDQRSKLSAPAAAQKQHAKLRRDRSWPQLPGFMTGRKKKGREAKPPAKVIHTAAAPTVERKYKEPYDWEQKEHAGGQVSHQRQVFVDLYAHHFTHRHLQAIGLIRAGFTLRDRERVTSARAYTGMPGGSRQISYTEHSLRPVDHSDQMPLTPKEREGLRLFDRIWARYTSQNIEWASRIQSLILHEEDEATGRIRSAAEIGAAGTKFRLGSDNSKAAGVAFGLDALDLFLETMQIVFLEEEMASRARKARMAEEVTRYQMVEKAKAKRRAS